MKVIYVVILMISMGSITLSEEWPMYMHDPQRTGYTENPGPVDETISWVYEFGSPLYSSPVIKNGVVYQGSREYLYALDSDTGALLWKTELAVVGSTPAVSEDTLVVATNKGISAVDIKSGDILWFHEIEDVSDYSEWMWKYYLSSPVIVDDRVVVGSGTNIFFSFPPDPESIEKCSKLLCLNIQTGELLWSVSSRGCVSTSPIFKDDMVFFTAEYVEAVDIWTGKVDWSVHSDCMFPSDPVLVKDLVIFANSDEIQAVAVNYGEIVWKTPLDSGISAIATDGSRLLGATTTSLLCLDANNGSILWETLLWIEINEPVDAPQSSSPAIAKDKVYVGSRDGSVYCVSVEDGTLLWKYQTDSPIVASPAVVDGKLYIGSTNGKLYCFGSNSDSEKEREIKKNEEEGGLCFGTLFTVLILAGSIVILVIMKYMSSLSKDAI